MQPTSKLPTKQKLETVVTMFPIPTLVFTLELETNIHKVRNFQGSFTFKTLVRHFAERALSNGKQT